MSRADYIVKTFTGEEIREAFMSRFSEDEATSLKDALVSNFEAESEYLSDAVKYKFPESDVAVAVAYTKDAKVLLKGFGIDEG